MQATFYPINDFIKLYIHKVESILGRKLFFLEASNLSFQLNKNMFFFQLKCIASIHITRMTTFIKTKFKKSDDHTNIDKYRVAANITEYYIISKLIFYRIVQALF